MTIFFYLLYFLIFLFFYFFIFFYSWSILPFRSMSTDTFLRIEDDNKKIIKVLNIILNVGFLQELTPKFGFFLHLKIGFLLNECLEYL